jgi:hypothetical protein
MLRMTMVILNGMGCKDLKRLKGNKMKATKYTTTIVIETLSLDSTEGFIMEAYEKLKDHRVVEDIADDGDYFRMETTKEEVEF